MRLFFLFCFLFLFGHTYAQLKQISFARQSALPSINQITKTQSTTLKAMQLPFWDDFSFNNSPNAYANDSLWQFGHSVWVNTGMGINPPTLKVATFDGIDSLALPYNISNSLAKGIGDKLVSRPIRMDLVAPTNQSAIFLSFYYQYQGNGEAPDPGDEFSLWFKGSDASWNKVWSVQYDQLSDNTKFIPVKLFVSSLTIPDNSDNSKTYFHNNFQFRFENYARLSGPFDVWNLDYVYLNNGVSQYDTTFAAMPDRAIVSPPTSVLKQYQSIPVKHLLATGDIALNYMAIPTTSLRVDQTSVGQVAPLTCNLTTVTRLNGVVSPPVTSLYDTIPSDKASPVGIIYGSNTIYNFDSIPRLKNFDPRIDSMALTFKIFLNTGDNVEKKKHYDPIKKRIVSGDYDSTVYSKIDFRVNDTIQTNFIFSNYYAYDDGEAEYAATLTNPGNYLAYQFDMMYQQADTLVAVDIYFPHVGDESEQVVLLSIWDDLSRPQIDSTQLTVHRTINNKFTRTILPNALIVKDKFFIGYKQNTTATIGVGLDKNSDSGSKIFAKLGTGWAPSTLYGNLMIRPVFGNSNKAKGPITAIEEKKITFYPNPNRGIFYLSQAVQNLQVTDIAGRLVSFEQEDSFESTQVTLHNASPGIYLARYFNGKQWHTEKIMVLP